MDTHVQNSNGIFRSPLCAAFLGVLASFPAFAYEVIDRSRYKRGPQGD